MGMIWKFEEVIDAILSIPDELNGEHRNIITQPEPPKMQPYSNDRVTVAVLLIY
jgi:hypothetical protein